jgi:hypothetical protein
VWSYTYTPPDVTPPDLTVFAPTDGLELVLPTVTVLGQTEPGATVSVAGTAASVAPDGTFSVPVALGPGDNKLEVVATDAAGNSRGTSVTVAYSDPYATLPDDYQTLNADYDALSDELSAVRDSATTSENLLEEARANILDLTVAQANAQGDLAEALEQNAQLASQGATLAMLAGVALIAGAAAVGLALVQNRRLEELAGQQGKGESEPHEEDKREEDDNKPPA